MPGRQMSATAAVIDGDRILLVRRRDLGTWEMPGGFVEEREAPWEAAVRECVEESGVRVSAGPLVGVYHRPHHDLTVLVFRCAQTGGSPAPSDEASEAGWFSIDQIPTPMVEVVRERITDASSGVLGAYRAQMGRGNADLRKSRRGP